MTRRELWERILGAAAGVYEPREARAVTARLSESLFGMRLTDVVVEPEAPYPIEDRSLLERVVRETQAGRPVQYIVGYTDFCGLRLHVEEGVLIPRPETEELVGWILAEEAKKGTNTDQGTRILDIGTGSGAIALALAAGMPWAQVRATDVSEQALRIARENGRANNLAVDFVRSDLSREAPPGGPYEIIVSNPPYVTTAEKSLMDRNVLDYEPHLALFVPDNDPLLFYRLIAQQGHILLAPGGSLYFEINERFGDETAALLEAQGYVDIEVRRDFTGKTRMVRARSAR